MNARSLSSVRSLNRRTGGVEKARALTGRTLFVFREASDTDEMVAARIRAMIASGAATENDRIIPFAWVDPQGEEGLKAHHVSADHDRPDREGIDQDRVET